MSSGKGELGRFRGDSNPRNCLEGSFFSTFLLPRIYEGSLKREPVGLSRFSVQSGNSGWSLSGEGVGGRGLAGGGNFGGGCDGGGKGGGAYLGRVSLLLSSVDLVATVFSEMDSDTVLDVALDEPCEGKVYEEIASFSAKTCGVGVDDLWSA